MAETRVSKATATNKTTGRLKKGYKAKGKGVYVKVSAGKPKAKTKSKTKRKSTRKKTSKVKLSLTRKIKKAFKK